MLGSGDKLNLKMINRHDSQLNPSTCVPDLAGVDIDALDGEVGPRTVHQAPAAAGVDNLQNRAWRQKDMKRVVLINGVFQIKKDLWQGCGQLAMLTMIYIFATFLQV